MKTYTFESSPYLIRSITVLALVYFKTITSVKYYLYNVSNLFWKYPELFDDLECHFSIVCLNKM